MRLVVWTRAEKPRNTGISPREPLAEAERGFSNDPNIPVATETQEAATDTPRQHAFDHM